MTDPDDAAWVAASRPVNDVACDTSFAVDTHIRFCDQVTGHHLPGPGIHLPAPDLPLSDSRYVSALDLLGRTDALVGHYRRVVDAFERAGRSAELRRSSPHSWLRLAVLADGEVVAGFPWYDHVPEAASVLQALIDAPGAPDGEVWDDLDQGWRVRIVKAGPSVCIAEWDWDVEEAVPPGHAFDAAALARQATGALDRLNTLHRQLVEALGFDYWTYHRWV